jgi:2-polyprenyl-6-methoxyphenol hydroxylase-like FAD-dependent oxidoreductase
LYDAEVIVIGAGPAGALLAAGLGDRGRQVLLIDRARFPRDKVCGEALSPGALALLKKAEVSLSSLGGAPTRGLRLVGAHNYSVEARYGAGQAGYSISRRLLDQALLERARATPCVSVLEGTALSALHGNALEGVSGVLLTDGQTLKAPLVVGADGRYSLVRRLAFGREAQTRARRFCFLNTFEGCQGEDDMLECGLVARGLQTLRVYQGQGRYSVCVVVDEAIKQQWEPGTTAGFLALVKQQPRLQERIGQAVLAGPMKGMPLMPYRAPHLVADGLLLAGDAVGFLDPITGEGMCRAFWSAQMAVETIDAALAHKSRPVEKATLLPYEDAMRRRFAPVEGFVKLAVRLTTLPKPASRCLISVLKALPPLATATAALQGALVSPEALLSPSHWPSFLSAASNPITQEIQP